MNPKSTPTATSPSPAADNLALDDAPPLEGEEVDEALAAEPVWVPATVGVADVAGYAAPKALISKGCDWA